MKYYKILSENLKSHNMQYQEGLNANCEETILDRECGNGLFFSDAEHILEFCDYGTKISDVTLPDGEGMCAVGDTKYKVHRMVLCNIRDLWTVETFKELTKEGVDIHAANDYALCLASSNGHLEVVKYLVKNGADIYAHDDYDALCLASENGHLEVVKFLVENGADIHACDDYALCLASENGHLEVVKYLVKNGANIHARDDYALRYASSNGYLEVVKFLVENGADIHACDDCALRYATTPEIKSYLKSIK